MKNISKSFIIVFVILLAFLAETKAQYSKIRISSLPFNVETRAPWSEVSYFWNNSEMVNITDKNFDQPSQELALLIDTVKSCKAKGYQAKASHLDIKISCLLYKEQAIDTVSILRCGDIVVNNVCNCKNNHFLYYLAQLLPSKHSAALFEAFPELK